ncbi:MAG: 50S ribosomal protein L6 [Prevotellaceae bacterium]|jgi:large subunit ribosomal protein L6|nr:50S ribosomal protein L6 [Prevotellaceae bacterium]
MSRIGKLPVSIPSGVDIKVENNLVTVKGPKGELSQRVNENLKIEVENGQLTIDRSNNEPQNRAYHGLYRALVQNMVKGVSEGYQKTLELVGVGYRASNSGQVLELSLGYSHNIFMQLPDEIKVSTVTERNQNPLIILEGCDKQLVGQVCAKIRSFRKPEPYKGKGVRFKGEIVRKKAGKTAGK